MKAIVQKGVNVVNVANVANVANVVVNLVKRAHHQTARSFEMTSDLWCISARHS